MLASSASAQVSFGFSTPGVSIGVNLGSYPNLVRIPGYPVYYAPSLNTNYFFYDGMYWVFDGDNWYASTWYNGPWGVVPPDEVPVFLLRVPVRYYVAAPVYFRSWAVSGHPRWGEHWGRRWEERHRNWDRWNRSSVPSPAPLPTYQRQYVGNRYPGFEEQLALESRNYRYRPQDRVVQQAFTERARTPQAAPQAQPALPQARIQQYERAQRPESQRPNGESRQQAQVQREQQAQAQRAQQQAESRQQEQGQRAQHAQAQRAQQQAQARQQEQAQRAQYQAQSRQQEQAQAQRAQYQAQSRQQEQAQRAQQAQAQAHQQEQAQRAQQAQAQRAQQAQAQRAQQAQAQAHHQQEQGQHAQHAQAQRAQQAQAHQQEQGQHAQHAQAQREQQNEGRGRGNERRDEHNG